MGETIDAVVKGVVDYGIIPAVFGAVGSLAYDDISALEGMRQMVAASLPIAVLFGYYNPRKSEDIQNTAGNHPYLFPLHSAAVIVGVYALSGLAMEVLTRTEIDQGFTSAAGGVEGLALGMLASIKERNK